MEKDRGEYPEALSLLSNAVELSGAVADERTAAYARAMLGRDHLLRGDLADAAEMLDASIVLSRRHHWLAFLPWPQALLGETQLALAEVSDAVETLDRAFAQACQLWDPCWDGASARGLALAADALGEIERTFQVMAEARFGATGFPTHIYGSTSTFSTPSANSD